VSLALLRRVQAAIRAAAGMPREVVDLGPFELYYEPQRSVRWFTYAIPQDDARPDAADVARIVEASTARERIPRVEYLPAVAPAVEDALLAGGFALELRGPLMTCAEPVAAPEVSGLTLELLDRSGPPEPIAAYMRVQRAAFGDDPGDPEGDVAAFRKRAGGTNLLALIDGEPAATGTLLHPQLGCAEVVGIGTLPAFRGRGVAAAVTAELTRRAFAVGAELAFLTPGGDEAQRIYARAGYAGVGDFLHLSWA
jgi:GNAT superfamily N-acetyltransferase